MDNGNKGKGTVFGVILVYNCAELLPDAFKKFPLHLFDRVIISDDGSTDNTFEVARSLGVPAFTNPHKGYGGNLKFALKKAVELGADYMIELHGDGQFDSAATPSAIGKLRSGCDFVLGNRFIRLFEPLTYGMGIIRFLGNLTLSFMARVVFQVKHRDFFTGLRGYSKRLVESVDLSAGTDDYFFSFEIIAMARYVGLSFCFVPTIADYRGKYTSMALWKGVIEIFQTSWTLFLYILAQCGLRFGIFSSLKKRSTEAD